MDFNKQEMEHMSQIAEEMQGKSEDQVINELVQLIKSGESGISPERAEEIITMLTPMMNSSQKMKMEKLIRELKK